MLIFCFIYVLSIRKENEAEELKKKDGLTVIFRKKNSAEKLELGGNRFNHISGVG